MKEHVPPDGFRICVRIAVTAEVSAGIIRADVIRKKTGAFSAGSFFLWKLQFFMDGLLKDPCSHAAAAVCAIGGQFRSFRAGPKNHTVRICHADHLPAQGQPFFLRNGPALRKIPEHFSVQIQKADDAGMGIALQLSGNFPES